MLKSCYTGRVALRLAVPVIASLALLLAATASAQNRDRRLPTRTTLSASPATIASSATTTLTATIKIGALVLPNGTVTFVDSTTKTTLAVVRVGRGCLFVLKPCKVSTTVSGSSLGTGANTITASYSGDIVEQPSSGSTVVTVQPSGQTTTTCAAGSGACTLSATSPFTPSDGAAPNSAGITSTAPGSGTESVTIGWDQSVLPCGTTGTGDTLEFAVTNAGSYKQVTYTVYGQEAINALNSVSASSTPHVCYESPQPFTDINGNPAQIDELDGLYYGVLPTCNYPAGAEGPPAINPPCVDGTSGAFGDNAIDSYYTDTFETTASDPRAGN